MEPIQLPTDDDFYAEVIRQDNEFFFCYNPTEEAPTGNEVWAIVDGPYTLHQLISETLTKVLWNEVGPVQIETLAREEGIQAFAANQIIADAIAGRRRITGN